MLKFMVIAALFGAVLCFPKPGLEYEEPVKHEGPFGMKNEAFIKNPFAQKLFSIKRLIPEVSIRTIGKLENDKEAGTKDVSSYTRATGEWFGVGLFGDLLYFGKNDTKRLGFGAGLGDLAKVYYNMDLNDLDKGYDLSWDAGF